MGEFSGELADPSGERLGRDIAQADCNPGHTEFRLPDNSIAAISPAPGKPTPQRSLWLVSFGSSRPGADAKRARQLGATEIRQDSNGGMILRDPTGALFGLTEYTR